MPRWTHILSLSSFWFSFSLSLLPYFIHILSVWVEYSRTWASLARPVFSQCENSTNNIDSFSLLRISHGLRVISLSGDDKTFRIEKFAIGARREIVKCFRENEPAFENYFIETINPPLCFGIFFLDADFISKFVLLSYLLQTRNTPTHTMSTRTAMIAAARATGASLNPPPPSSESDKWCREVESTSTEYPNDSWKREREKCDEW